ncbi:hypothetical protein EGI22_18055 [Lacihabitans sp. LS3-19]|nr:hypothetical protein [Lacihabitans sp. LS3-19]
MILFFLKNYVTNISGYPKYYFSFEKKMTVLFYFIRKIQLFIEILRFEILKISISTIFSKINTFCKPKSLIFK